MDVGHPVWPCTKLRLLNVLRSLCQLLGLLIPTGLTSASSSSSSPSSSATVAAAAAAAKYM